MADATIIATVVSAGIHPRRFLGNSVTGKTVPIRRALFVGPPTALFAAEGSPRAYAREPMPSR
ncbi:hypothetical protein ACFWY9_29180 [Amycolatopsis sp. NPDC059027]|uniref:hypothetical protein n=1 Tax=Amycolatopsis sp. NPDC059027 TaxID=3346709 RepID=UPI00366EDA3B